MQFSSTFLLTKYKFETLFEPVYIYCEMFVPKNHYTRAKEFLWNNVTALILLFFHVTPSSQEGRHQGSEKSGAYTLRVEEKAVLLF